MRVGCRVGDSVNNKLGFRTGRLHRFYDSASEVAAAVGYTPAHIWKCDETSGNLADSVGSGTLTATGSPAASQYAVPTPYANRAGIGITSANAAYFASGGTGVIDPGTGSVAFVSVGRWGEHIGTLYMNLRYASSQGWLAQRYASGLYFYCDDGAGGGAGVNLFHTTAPIPSDAYCAFGWGYDTVAAQAWVAIASDTRSAVTRASISGLSFTAVTAQLYLGFTSNWDHDYLWAAGFTGANAQMYGNELSVVNKLFRG